MDQTCCLASKTTSHDSYCQARPGVRWRESSPGHRDGESPCACRGRAWCYTLLREGQTVPLTPKVFEILKVLVENHGHLFEKDELMKSVWPDSFVEEGNL